MAVAAGRPFRANPIRFFDAVILQDGHVAEYLASREHEAEVVVLMDLAYAR